MGIQKLLLIFIAHQKCGAHEHRVNHPHTVPNPQTQHSPHRCYASKDPCTSERRRQRRCLQMLCVPPQDSARGRVRAAPIGALSLSRASGTKNVNISNGPEIISECSNPLF